MFNLENLRVGETLKVVGYADESKTVSRLKSIGLIPGTQFTIHRVAPLGDPIEIRFRGYSLGIRKHEVACLALDAVV